MGLRMLEFPIRIFSIVRLLGRWPGLMISILRVGSCGQFGLGIGVMKSLFYCPRPAQTDGLPKPVWGTMTWWELVKSGVKCQGIHKQRRAEKLKRKAEN
jgi:hypothetical protein